MHLIPLPPEVWERTPAEAQADIRALASRVVGLEDVFRPLEATVRQLEATVQHLTEPLQQDSRTSSRPPSSNPPQATAKQPRRDPSGR